MTGFKEKKKSLAGSPGIQKKGSCCQELAVKKALSLHGSPDVDEIKALMDLVMARGIFL